MKIHHRIYPKVTISKKALFPAFLFFCFFLSGCKKESFPKPTGYFRIELKDKTYSPLTGNYPFSFETSSECFLTEEKSQNKNYWFDLHYPFYKARIYCSYLPVHSGEELRKISEDNYRFVFQHTIKADAIEEETFRFPSKKVYGIRYLLSGNTATPVQLVITDSVKHFFRASLYFESTPNQDSLRPVIHYLNEDITRIIETFQWK